MDKIYSRKRIDLKKINNIRSKSKLRKIIIIVIFLIVVSSVMNIMIKAIDSMIEKQGGIRAKSIATVLTNQATSKIMAKYEYLDIANIERDSNGSVTTISANAITINKIISDIPVELDNRLNDDQYSAFKIRLGTMLGMKIFANRGPCVKFRISDMGVLDTELRSEFTSVGINQTLHRIYLQIDTKVSILTPYRSIEEKISNQVLLAETVIVGNIPQTYYNMEGIKAEDAMEAME